MLLELVFTTSPHPFGSSFFKLGCHGIELGTCSSVVLYFAKLCKGNRLEIRVGMDLIRRHYGGVTSSNAVAFTEDGARDLLADLSTAESAVNTEVMKDLSYFI